MREENRSIKIADSISRIGHYFHFCIGSGRYRLLSILLEHGGSIEQKELQEALDIRSGSISEIINKICCDDLIVKKRSEKDGRQFVVCLTENGKTEAMRIRSEYEAHMAKLFKGFSEDEKVMMLDLLQKLLSEIGNAKTYTRRKNQT